jgi:mRNA interferase HigB
VQFEEDHVNAANPLGAWHRLMKARQLTNWAELKETFGTADLLEKTQLSFDIGGNRYRLITCITQRRGA